MMPTYRPVRPRGDWLLGTVASKAGVFQTDDGLALSNGLVSRIFRIGNGAGTVALDDLMTGESLLRAVSPEAVLEIDGQREVVGGLAGQTDRAFLTDAERANLVPMPGSLPYLGFETGVTTNRMPWGIRGDSSGLQPFVARAPQPGPLDLWQRHRLKDAAEPRAEGPIHPSAPDGAKDAAPYTAAWPPSGVSLTLRFGDRRLEVDVRYEIYDGIPLIGKLVRVKNLGPTPFHVTSFATEDLSIVEAESNVDASAEWRKPPVTVVTDYSFAGMSMGASNRTVSWEPEPEYATQVNYDLKTPCRLAVRAPVGPDQIVAPGQDFDTFWTWMLVHDSTDRERQGLAVRKMYRLLAPWTADNPLMLHLTSTQPEVVKHAIDQAADVGFEMVIFSFGSGLDMEDVSPENIAKFRGFAEYAHAKGLRVGGYSLLASRHIDDANDVINPKTGKPGGAVFGFSPCLCSEWGEKYFEHLRRFLTETRFDLLEHDGSYPGDVCASTKHPGHRGLADSQWAQYQVIAGFYRWCRERGIFLNVPDTYFLAGSNKTGMGYRETNWSLPRAQQHIHARQNLFDGTWEKTPSMGWMFVPLVEYQGGGAAATIEPLHEHLADYRLHLMNNLGYGVQACYRGPRLYDTPETREMVAQWVAWFKRHRAILESDVIHVRRADGRNLDTVLHVNPALETKAMAVVYNPLDHPLKQEIVLPLYYAGLKGRVEVRLDDGAPVARRLDSGANLAVEVEVPGRSCAWVTIR